MKLITCVIRPNEVEHLREALTSIQVGGITISEAQGFASRNEDEQFGDGRKNNPHYAQRVELEVVVPDTMVETVLDTVMKSGRTGDIGDGKIFLQDVCQAVRIRTGEFDEAAL